MYFHWSKLSIISIILFIYFIIASSEFGSISPELNSIYQAGIVGLLVGVVYGGFIQSRYTYMNFMENNQASAFKSHIEAKVNSVLLLFSY